MTYTKICYIKTRPNVKFSLYLKEAGLASRNIANLKKKSSYVLSISAFLFFAIFLAVSRLKHRWLKIPRKYQVQRKSYPCHGFCICQTLFCNISWIASCLKVRNSTNLQANCRATSPTAEINSSHDHRVITFLESRE